MCHPGYYAAGNGSGVILCNECPIGFFKATFANSQCTQCDEGWITETSGSRSSEDCSIRKLFPQLISRLITRLAVVLCAADCSPGEYLRNLECLVCPFDSYQERARQESCDDCANSQITLQQASLDSANCGWFTHTYSSTLHQYQQNACNVF